VKAWNRDYAKLGLVVVGVRAPEFEAEIRRLLVAANPGIKLPAVSPEATAFAKTGEPSYAGITGETYVGAERREPGSVTLEGDWQSERQYLELKKASGKIVLSFTAGEVNLVMHRDRREKRRSRCSSTENRSARPAAPTSAPTEWPGSIGQE
jgi:hypothetical protein